MLTKISFIAAVFSMIFFSTLTVFSQSVYPIKVAGGGRHTLVLMSDGTIVGWGATDMGALGPSAAIPQDTKHATQIVSIKLPRKAVDIAAMDESSFAVLDDGSVVGWGYYLKSETPVKLPNLSNIVKIACGSIQGIALRRDGTVYQFDNNNLSGTPVQGLQNIKDISIAGHAVALDANGEVWTWMPNAKPDIITDFLGVIGRKNNPLVPAKIAGLNNVVSISAQPAVSTVVKRDGTVWVWGSNHMAQFANGRKSDVPNRGDSSEIVFAPQQIAGISNAAAVANGTGVTTIILLKDGTLRSWGNNQKRSVGVAAPDYVTKPAIPKIAGVKSAFVVGLNSFAVKNDNTLWFWGADTTWGFPFNKTLSAPKLLELK